MRWIAVHDHIVELNDDDELWLFSFEHKEWIETGIRMPLKCCNVEMILTADSKSIHFMGGLCDDGSCKNHYHHHFRISCSDLFRLTLKEYYISKPQSVQKVVEYLSAEDEDEDNDDEKKADGSMEKDLCRICMHRSLDHVCLPCGHLCLCGVCKDKMDGKCPMCQQPYGQIIKVYK